ncbi:TPA: hypothetical protein DDZ10_01435 [Candidatus Uhrbacteria bacterium]|nr:hypothetical protein [Candidatus Uhrbacteria bacterium]
MRLRENIPCPSVGALKLLEDAIAIEYGNDGFRPIGKIRIAAGKRKRFKIQARIAQEEAEAERIPHPFARTSSEQFKRQDGKKPRRPKRPFAHNDKKVNVTFGGRLHPRERVANPYAADERNTFQISDCAPHPFHLAHRIPEPLAAQRRGRCAVAQNIDAFILQQKRMKFLRRSEREDHIEKRARRRGAQHPLPNFKRRRRIGKKRKPQHRA